MTGALLLADGTVSAPGATFASAPTTGFYKSTLGMAAAVGGVKVMDFGSSASFVDGGDIASANALTLGTGNVFNITGTTAVTSIATKGVGTICWLRFNAILTLTYHATNLILTTAANITTAAGDWGIFEEYGAGTWRMIGYVRASGAALVTSSPRGYIDGCTLSNGTDTTNDINIAAGTCRDSTNAVDIVIATALGKQLDANWTVGGTTGTPLGGRNSAAGITDTTYHVYAVRTVASSTADIYFHTSTTIATVLTALQAESGGTLYVYARCIGSIVRLSTAILQFTQIGDDFLLTTPIRDLANATPGTTANTCTLTAVPTGFKMLIWINILTDATGAYVSSLDQTDNAVSATLAPLCSTYDGANSNGTMHFVYTNTAAQFRYRVSANSPIYMSPIGYRHPRGQNQ